MEHKGKLNELALFAGAGGGILGGVLGECKTVCAVEIDAYCTGVLIQRQNDGILPPFPVWDDVRTFDGRPWRGIVDVVSGGFPCQNISAAGKGEGIEGEKSGLWVEMARIIGEVRPRFVFVENSPMLTSRGLGRVLGDLAQMGFNARWGVIGAADLGAPHIRKRIWIIGYAYGEGEPVGAVDDETSRVQGDVADANCARSDRRENDEICAGRNAVKPCLDSVANAVSKGPQITWWRSGEGEKYARFTDSDWWKTEPDVGRVVDGMANQLDLIGTDEP